MPRDADDLLLRVLVVRCQVGDRVALQELLGRFQNRLRGFVFKLLPPSQRQRLDDLVQDVWADVFAGLPALSDAAAFGPWLYRIARNRVYRSARRGKFWEAAVASDVDVASIADDESADEPFSPEDAAAVHAALDQLPAEHREVVLLRFVEGMAYTDIAAVVGVPVGTVRSRLFNAKRSLRTLLERENTDVRI
jgi:RNA polymerase sigma-70 factor (ECF subfamily)